MEGQNQKLSPELGITCSSSRKLFSPFSPMDTSGIMDQKSTTTPRRRLSLNVDENAQSPLATAFEVDAGYGDSQGDDRSGGSSCSSLEASLNGRGLELSGSPGALGAARFVLHELKPSVWNRGTSRKTRTARRMRKNFSSVSISEDKENSIRKDAANLPDAIKIPCPSPLSNRPSSLPAFPLSPLTQDPRNSSSLLKQINSPLERMSLMSPTTAHPLHPSPYQRHTSTTSAADSDGYFSEVFDSEEQDDPAPLPGNLTTLISAPLVNSPSSLTFINKVLHD